MCHEEPMDCLERAEICLERAEIESQVCLQKMQSQYRSFVAAESGANLSVSHLSLIRK